ncbi:unnamed protein product [Durusdinium trenchii]|uniref:1,3-beta-glucan synthase n=1 Tax=Durusdinium trenchii TaxID=1381693 RepID=A0ABP0S697_9DINO
MKPVTLKILFQEFSAEPEAASNQITGMQPENDSLEVHLPLTSFNTSGEFTFFFLAWAWFRRCARLACSALRQDSKNYFSHAAARIIEADEGHVSSKLWAAIRHRLPGKQKRSSGFSPLACERLDDQWHPHFDALELGEATTPGSLLEACHARQQNAPKLLPLRDELPTIMDVEAALRRVSPNKKGGDDQVLGGVLHWAAPAIAQEVTCLFAYHRLVRSLSVGLGDSGLRDFDACMRSLDPRARLEYVRSALAPTLLESIFEGQAILLMLQEIHIDTFFHLHKDFATVTRTSRGSRPGSPLADVIFSCAMIRIHEDLELAVRSHPSVRPAAAVLGLEPSLTTWADDVAIELCCSTADVLVPLTCDIAKVVRRIFAARGMHVNLGPTKTCAALTFKGRGAPAARTFHLVEEKGCLVADEDFGNFWLPFVARYKHLGTAFSTEGDLAHEIAERIGAASSALVAVRKPLVGNRKLNSKTRHSLAEALVCSRLLFGAGVQEHGMHFRVVSRRGSTPFSRSCFVKFMMRNFGEPLMGSLFLLTTSFMVTMLCRSLMCGWPGFAFVMPGLISAAQVEKQCCPDAWLLAVEADLQWLRAVVPNAPFFADDSWEGHLRYWQEQPGPWKQLVHRACALHLWQSRTNKDTLRWHGRIIDLLEQSGMERSVPPSALPVRAVEASGALCHCGRRFASRTALAVHQVHTHGEHAPEWHMAQDTVCGACLRSFWTKARLKQHLAYLPRSGAPNACFEALRQRSFPSAYALVGEPAKLPGLARHDALPAAGPVGLGLTLHEEKTQQWRDELLDFRARLRSRGFFEDGTRVDQGLHPTLDEITTLWYDQWLRDYPHGPNLEWLQGAWLTALSDSGNEDAAFLSFGRWESALGILHSSWEDGEASHFVEDAFVRLCADVELLQWVARCDQLARLLDLPSPEDNSLDRIRADQVRARRIQHRNLGEQRQARVGLSRPYAAQDNFAVDFDPDLVRVPPGGSTTVPCLCRGLTRRCFLVVHLFSGHRRVRDFHWHLQRMAAESDFDIAILSFDTAVDSTLGDLRSCSTSWKHLETLYHKGLVAATLAGSPCETFSEARWTPLVDALGVELRGPRPLRTTARPWGLDGLTLREMRQLAQGSAFALQVLWCACATLLWGGFFISEHPAAPRDEGRATMWRMPIMQTLLQAVQAQLVTIAQWRWGSRTPKPTTLLAIRLPFLRASMDKWQIGGLKKPEACAMGLHDGVFRTEEMKTYSEALSAAFAQGIFDGLRKAFLHGHLRTGSLPKEVEPFVTTLRHLSGLIDPQGHRLSDFQDRVRPLALDVAGGLDHHRHGLHFTGVDFHQYGGPDDIGEASRALPDAEDAEKHTPCGLKKVWPLVLCIEHELAATLRSAWCDPDHMAYSAALYQWSKMTRLVYFAGLTAALGVLLALLARLGCCRPNRALTDGPVLIRGAICYSIYVTVPWILLQMQPPGVPLADVTITKGTIKNSNYRNASWVAEHHIAHPSGADPGGNTAYTTPMWIGLLWGLSLLRWYLTLAGPIWAAFLVALVAQWQIFGPLTGQSLFPNLLRLGMRWIWAKLGSEVLPQRIPKFARYYSHSSSSWIFHVCIIAAAAWHEQSADQRRMVITLPIYDLLIKLIHSYYRRSLQLAYFCDGEDIEFPAAADSPYCPNLLLGACINDFRRPEDKELLSDFTLTPLFMGCPRTGFFRTDRRMRLGYAISVSGAAPDTLMLTKFDVLPIRFLLSVFSLRLGDFVRLAPDGKIAAQIGTTFRRLEERAAPAAAGNEVRNGRTAAYVTGGMMSQMNEQLLMCLTFICNHYICICDHLLLVLVLL